jgi:hypothetical protein
MHILLIFLDGIGLGADDPAINPFAAAHTPTLMALANGHRWLRGVDRQDSDRAVFLPLDANMGIPGKPQSGTNQAAILTGLRVPELMGRHYGPKPDAETRALLDRESFFKTLGRHGRSAALMNAYPPRLHHDINRGKVLRTSIQHAVHAAGLPMYTDRELYNGEAMSEDFTGAGWRKHLNYSDTPLLSPAAAGRKMVEVSRRWEFAFFSHWLTDIIGHRGTLDEAIKHLELIDAVLAGALEVWDNDEGLLLVVSDHGNFEAMDHGKHTENAVPALIVGREKTRFADELTDLAGLVPRMSRLLLGPDADQRDEVLDNESSDEHGGHRQDN